MLLSAIKFCDFKVKKGSNTILNIPIDKIRPNPYQPRKYFDIISLVELSESIREYGVLQPVTVRFINNCSYELVSGERRLRASKIAGLETIPCIVVKITDNESAVMALIENIQRQNLNFFEEAEGYENLLKDYNLTQEELSKKLKKSQSAIANKIRLLRLSPDIRKIIIDNGLTERHARAIIRIPDSDIQREVLKTIIDKDFNVKKTEELVEREIAKIRNNESQYKINQKEKIRITDIRILKNTVKQTVDIIKKSGIEAGFEDFQHGDFYEINIKIKL